MDISREKSIWMFETMLKIRHFEDRVKNLFAAGELPAGIPAQRPVPARDTGYPGPAA